MKAVAKRPARRATRPPPPPGTGHFLLWILCSAIYLALFRMLAAEALQGESPGLIGTLIASVQSLVYGAAWAGMCIVVSGFWRGERWPVEPGHWLFVVLGIRLALEVAIQFVPGEIIALPRAVVAASVCCSALLPLLSRRLSPIWKGFFGVMLLLYGLPLFGMLFGAAVGTPFRDCILAGLSLLISVWLHHRKIRYGWLHWSAAATYAAIASAEWLFGA